MQSMRLTAADRRFFSRIAGIVFMNPFADQRAADLSGLLAEFAPEQGDSQSASILPQLNERIAKLEARGLGTVDRFDGDDRAMMAAVFLYRLYHRFVEHFDRLIGRQVEGRSADVSFAEELLRQMGAHGFAEPDA